MLTRDEKVRRVIELYEAGKTYREIAKEVRISPSDISYILKRHTGEMQVEPGQENSVERRKRQEQEETIDTKVFKLFEEGKTPIEVKISLNLSFVEVERLQREYWRLKGLHGLEELYEDIGNDVFQFLQTCKFIKNEGHTPRQVIEVADHLDELPLLRSEGQRLELENQNLRNEQQKLNGSISVAKENLSAINHRTNVEGAELELLKARKRQVQMGIAKMITSSGYQKMQRITEATARNILTQNKVVLVIAFRALIQALREEPKNELYILINWSLNYPMYEPKSGYRPNNYLQMQQAMLLELAERMYIDLLSKVINDSMSSALNTSGRQ